MLISLKMTFTATSRLLDQISGYSDLGKLRHKINHHIRKTPSTALDMYMHMKYACKSQCTFSARKERERAFCFHTSVFSSPAMEMSEATRWQGEKLAESLSHCRLLTCRRSGLDLKLRAFIISMDGHTIYSLRM